jgi:predicted TIM-barrel fold metal-dependent hydrolase
MEIIKQEANGKLNKQLGIIDCDVHQSVNSYEDLKPYLPRSWWNRLGGEGYGVGSGGVFPGPNYPSPVGILREDSYPENGAPGSDIEFTKKQLLDEYGIEYAILTGAALHLSVLANADFASSMASAYNQWTAEKWLNADSRFKGSIIIAPQDPKEAAKEIDRWASNPNFIQVQMGGAAKMPYGDRYFDPIFEACERNSLPLAIHPGAEGDGVSHPLTPLGHVQHYIERHCVLPQTIMTHLITMVFQGVFNKFPRLKVVVLEYGIAWMPQMMWRMDKNYKGLRMEVPWLEKRPSDYIREHVRLATQPIEEPDKIGHLDQIIEMMGTDKMVMFSSDYPHWDFDSPKASLNLIKDKNLRNRILRDNAKEFYGL